jgi:hypothetical protein
MSQETYKQLRVEFQKLREQYEQIKGPKFSIQICAPDPVSTDLERAWLGRTG